MMENNKRKNVFKRNGSIDSLRKLKSFSNHSKLGQIFMQIGSVPPSKQKINHKIFSPTQIFG